MLRAASAGFHVTDYCSNAFDLNPSPPHFEQVTTQKLNCSSCWTPGEAVRSGECGGSFTLGYDGHHTDEISFESNAATIKAALVKLPGAPARTHAHVGLC